MALEPRPFQRSGPARAMAGTLAATALLLPPALLLKRLGHHGPGKLPRTWHRIVLKSLGVRPKLEGQVAHGSVLYVANHVSWLDIPLLGAHLEAAFVAKSEVGEMPGVSYLADLQKTIFVEREQRRQSAAQSNVIKERLLSGGNVILFPEGTSNDGVRVLPFKTSLFSAIEGVDARDITVQPVTLAYTHLNAMPLTRRKLMDVAWVGDMDFVPHALDFMRLGRTSATIVMHEPVRRADFSDRKALARHCHAVISSGYQKLMRGEL